MSIDLTPNIAPSRMSFVEEHVAGQIGDLTVIVGEYGSDENGDPMWAVVVRHDDRDDWCFASAVHNTGDSWDRFRMILCDHAMLVRNVLQYASENVGDLRSKPKVLHS